MKRIISVILIIVSYNLIGQVPNKFEYPDTLWIYGNVIDSTYGFTSKNPIKVGGGILPKHVYRFFIHMCWVWFGDMSRLTRG